MVSKLWLNKQKFDYETKRRMGLSYKILQLEITPKFKKPTVDEFFSQYRFIDQKKININDNSFEENIEIKL